MNNLSEIVSGSTLKVRIESCTEGKSNNFVTKLISETVEKSEFGDIKRKNTFFVSLLSEQEVGKEIDLEVGAWNWFETLFTANEGQVDEEVIPLKWLSRK